MPRLSALLACATSLVLALPGTARADAIDGAWCLTGQGRLEIQGPRLLTAAGNRVEGDYGRHSFRYVVPAGEPGAGETIHLQLVHDQLIRLRRATGEESWSRCGPPTS